MKGYRDPGVAKIAWEGRLGWPEPLAGASLRVPRRVADGRVWRRSRCAHAGHGLRRGRRARGRRAAAGRRGGLKQEVRDQRQLILQLMQAEQQRYDIVLKYLQSGGAAIPRDPAAPFGGIRARQGRQRERGQGRRRCRIGRRAQSAVTGHVRTSGQALGEVYVYLDGVRASPSRGHTVEIKQKDKQFSPRVAVVPLGTRLIFPNQDTVIHNVFSTASGNSFDLGSVKGARRRLPSRCSSPGRSRSSATSTRRCAPTSWWCRTRTGRASRQMARSRCPASRWAPARSCSGARRSNRSRSRSRSRRRGDGDVRFRGHGGSSAHEQARSGVRFVR